MDDLKILVVDDEIANLQKLRRTFVHRYPVLAAESGREALRLIRAHEGIAVIIADQRMPDMTGVELLRQTLPLLPDAVRIILTGYTDVDVLMEAINTCKVYRYMVKPWDPPDLQMTVQRGLEAYQLTLENAKIRKELVRRERQARELEIAGEIQRCILPAGYPQVEGYEIAVEYHPAREMGGDLYDFDRNRTTGALAGGHRRRFRQIGPGGSLWGGIQRQARDAVCRIAVSGRIAGACEFELDPALPGQQLYSRGLRSPRARLRILCAGQRRHAFPLPGA